jgi:hypothetical protein
LAAGWSPAAHRSTGAFTYFQGYFCTPSVV